MPLSKISFRRILPIVSLSLFIALTLIGQAEQAIRDESQRSYSTRKAPTKVATPIGNEEMVSFDLQTLCWPPIVPPALSWRLGINLPAVILATPVVSALGHRITESNTTTDCILGLCVVIFWYFLGRFVDRSMISNLQLQKQHLPAKWIRAVAALFKYSWAFGGILLALSVLNPHHSNSYTQIVGTCVALWSVIGAYAIHRLQMRWRIMMTSAPCTGSEN